MLQAFRGPRIRGILCGAKRLRRNDGERDRVHGCWLAASARQVDSAVDGDLNLEELVLDSKLQYKRETFAI